MNRNTGLGTGQGLMSSGFLDEMRRGLGLGRSSTDPFSEVSNRFRSSVAAMGIDRGGAGSSAPASAPALPAPAQTPQPQSGDGAGMDYFDWKPPSGLRESAWKMVADAISDDRYSPDLRYGLWQSMQTGKLSSDLVRRLYEERAKWSQRGNETQSVSQSNNQSGGSESWFDPRMFWMALMMRMMMQ